MARGSVIELSGGGDEPVRALRTPVRYVAADGTPLPFDSGPPPALGEHTDAALAAAGYGADEIAALRREGVV